MKKLYYLLITLFICSLPTLFPRTAQAMVCIVDDMKDCPAPLLGCERCTTNWSCSNGGTCPGNNNCPKQDSHGDPTQAGCNATCPDGYDVGEGPNQCTVNCSPCGNHVTCHKRETPPAPSQPPAPPKNYVCKPSFPTCFACDSNNPSDCVRNDACCHRTWSACDNGKKICYTTNTPGGQDCEHGDTSTNGCAPATTPPPPPPGARCDGSCGLCGYRNSNGTCTTNNNCCNKKCTGNKCEETNGSYGAADQCQNDQMCATIPSITPSQPPTPTPTPDFNPAMCKCDGITADNLFAGSTTKVTAHAKVQGEDVTKAKVTTMQYFMAKGNTIIGRSDKLPAQVESSNASLVRYFTDWSTKIPSNVSNNSVYTIWVNIACVPAKTTALGYSPLYNPTTNTAVLGAKTENKGLIGKVIDTVFGVKQQSVEQPAETTGEVLGSNTLQIDTFYPAQKVTKSCKLIQFQFNTQAQ